MILALLVLVSLAASSLAQVCNCNNRGYCVDFMCVCNYGFSGANCQNMIQFYTAELLGSNEVPPVSTPGKGIGRASFDSLNNVVTVGYRVQGLIGTVVNAHIHKAPAGLNGPVAVQINITLPITVTTPTSPNWDVVALENQGMYINVHSNNYTGGEVRGQLLPYVLPPCPQSQCNAQSYCVSELFGFECYCLPGYSLSAGSCVPENYITQYLVNKVQIFRFLFRDRFDSSTNKVRLFNANLVTDSMLSDGKGAISNDTIITTSPFPMTQNTCFVLHTTWRATTSRALRLREPGKAPFISTRFSSNGSIQLLNGNQVLHSTRPNLLSSSNINYISFCFRSIYLIIHADGQRISDWRIPAVTPGNYIAQLGPSFAGVIDEFFAYNENQPLVQVDSSFFPFSK